MTKVSKITQVTFIDNKAKKIAWKQHYEGLLNEKFSWKSEDLTADPVVGALILITIEMLVKTIIKMKNGKAAGPLGILAEMLKAFGDTGAAIRASQQSITANLWPLTAHIYHVMIIVTGGFSKKSFFINIIFISKKFF